MRAPNTTTSRTLLAARLRLARARAAGQVDPTPRPDYTRPPRRRTEPPPQLDWPIITTLEHSVWGTVAHPVNQLIQGVEYGASGPPPGQKGHAVLNLPVGVVHSGNTWDNCRWVALMGEANNMLWLLRGFDVVGSTFSHCEFIGPVWEHGAYLGAPLALSFKDVLFRGQRAAAVQIAHRFKPGMYETVLPEAGLSTAKNTHLYARCRFEYQGDPKSERFGAFTLSEHPPEVVLEDGTAIDDLAVDVVVDSCVFLGGHLEHWYSGSLWRSNRSFMVGNRKAFHMIDTVIDCPAPVFGWAGQTHNVGDVVLHRNEILDGKVEIKNPKRVSIQGNSGGAVVRVGTGPGKGEGLTNVIYEGPIHQGFEWTAS